MGHGVDPTWQLFGFSVPKSLALMLLYTQINTPPSEDNFKKYEHIQ